MEHCDLLDVVENKEAIGERGIVGSLVRLLSHPNELLQMQVHSLPRVWRLQ